MSPYFFTRRTLIFFAGLLILLCAFTAFEAWRQHIPPGAEQTAEAQPVNSLAAQEARLSQENAGLAPADTQKCHLALLGERLCIYAGPLGGGGELLQELDIPLQAIPARWLAQLTNGGIEFANKETLLMALDNLDELTEEDREVMAQ